MRADFYQRCAANPELASQVATHQYLVSPLSYESLREVIEATGPPGRLELDPRARRSGAARTPGSSPETLPLLEHALWELWQRRQGRRLILQAYQQTGRVTGALAKRADR